MKTIGTLFMVLGAAVGLTVALAMFAHAGVAGAWLVNVALAKLGLVAAAGGAVAVRIAKRREQRQLEGTQTDVG